jgi:hypothetical protein
MSRSRHAPRYVTIEQAVEALLAGKEPPPPPPPPPPPQHPRQQIALEANDDNRTEPSDLRRQIRKRQRQSEAETTPPRAFPSGAGEREKDDCDSESRAGRGNDPAIENEEEEEPRGRLVRWANVVAVVSDVSEAQPTRASAAKAVAAASSSRRRSDGAAAQLYVWIQDESLQGATDPNPSRHRAAVTYWQPANTKKQQQQQQLPQLLRAGDVVALHGLVLRKSCLRKELQDHQQRQGLGGNLNTDIDTVPPYEFVHDANATVFQDHPLLEKVRLVARIDPETQRVHQLNIEDGRSHGLTTTPAGADSTLSRRVSHLIQWYLAKPCNAFGTSWRTLADAVDDDGARHCLQPSVADWQATLGVCGHVVAQVMAIQDHSYVNDAVARQKEAPSKDSNRKRRSTPPRSHEAHAPVAFVLLKDSTASVPIPLVLLGRNNVRTFRGQLEGLLSTGGPDSGTGRWVRWTRVKSVRMRDALRGTRYFSSDIDDTAVALIPTDASTVSLVDREEASDFSNSGACLPSQLQSAASLETSQPTQLGSADATHRRMAASTTVTVEAPIASIRIALGATSSPTTIVLNAANVQDNVARVLALLRQPIQGRAANVEKSSDKKAGRVDDVAVSITLDWSDAAALGSLPIDLHNRSHLTASQHVVRSLFWGGAKWESVVSGRLDDICCRMVAGMLQEYVRFHWILERQDTSYRIVDVSLRQL